MLSQQDLRDSCITSCKSNQTKVFLLESCLRFIVVKMVSTISYQLQQLTEKGSMLFSSTDRKVKTQANDGKHQAQCSSININFAKYIINLDAAIYRENGLN